MIQLSIFSIELPPARNQLAAVLKALIENKNVSERDTVFNGFRSRISELRRKHELNIGYITEDFVNQFNHSSTFRRHYLLPGEKEKAIEIYNQINK